MQISCRWYVQANKCFHGLGIIKIKSWKNLKVRIYIKLVTTDCPLWLAEPWPLRKTEGQTGIDNSVWDKRVRWKIYGAYFNAQTNERIYIYILLEIKKNKNGLGRTCLEESWVADENSDKGKLGGGGRPLGIPHLIWEDRVKKDAGTVESNSHW